MNNNYIDDRLASFQNQEVKDKVIKSSKREHDGVKGNWINLDILKEELEEIKGNWNGKDDDIRAHRASYADYALEIIEELEGSIDEAYS